jgi:hypothetical protein
LLTDDGRWSAHVDLGAIGTADRWADLAIATWNVTLNYGAGWENLLLDAYGVALDAERSRMESVRRALRRCAVIISRRAAPCRDESRDRASANRSPESFINGPVFTLKGLTLAR